MDKSKALVCVSGGQDSTYCLKWAIDRFGRTNVEAVNFEYGQVHNLELRAVVDVCSLADVPLLRLHVPALKQIQGGGLTMRSQPRFQPGAKHPDFNHLPLSFVPLRNLILFSTAAAHAVACDIGNLVVGVSQADYSGYPDCRETFIYSLRQTIDLALGGEASKEVRLLIHTPLMHMSKAEMVHQAMSDPELLRMWAYTHTCYNNQQPPCGECDACILRAKAFAKAGIEDPLIERLRKEGKV
jgi:7-cyano-7-deazaguanine synthase